MNKIKELGQVFTPDDIIDTILDIAGYCGTDIADKKILEPAFGDGRIIKKIIDRLVVACRQKNLCNNEIAYKIKNNIYGIECDVQLYQKAKNDIIDYINDAIGTFVGINLYCENTLIKYKEFVGKFDYVCGNPPYSDIHHTDNQLLKMFEFSKNGSSDIYLAFYDVGLQMLNENGKLCYIAPSAWFYNKSGFVMRKTVTTLSLLSYILDFRHQQIFQNHTTYTAIVLLNKSSSNFSVTYRTKEKEEDRAYNTIWLQNQFCFNDEESVKKYRKMYENTKKKCCVKNGYATLMDSFFIDNQEMPNNRYMISVYKSSCHSYHRCFFPYNEDGTIVLFSQIQKEEPNLANYLLKNKKQLLKRALENSEMWYGFGRSQAIRDTYKRKYGISTIIKKKSDIHISLCKSGVGVYGGLYILTDISLNKMRKVFVSDKFIAYASSVGSLKNGGYYSLTSQQVEKYLNFTILYDPC